MWGDVMKNLVTSYLNLHQINQWLMNRFFRKGLTGTLILMTCGLLAVSCHNEEWTSFEEVELDVKGIALHQSGTCEYAATIPASGATFTATANGKNREFGYLGQFFGKYVDLDGKTIHVAWLRNQHTTPSENDSFYLPGNKLPQGPWGRVRYLNEQVPYSTEISIAPNDSKEPREFEFQFGMAYTITVIHVTQQGSTE